MTERRAPFRNGAPENPKKQEFRRTSPLTSLYVNILGNESVAATLLALTVEDRQGRLHERMDELQKSHLEKGWSIPSIEHRRRFSKILIPAGLVEREKDAESGEFTLHLTEDGRRAVALVGHLLDFSLQYPDFSTLGAFSRRIEIRNPRIVNIKLDALRLLLESTLPLSLEDLSERLGESKHVVQRYVDTLAHEGVITRQFLPAWPPANKLYSRSPERPKEEPTPHPMNHRLSGLVYSAISTHEGGSFTIGEIADRLLEEGNYSAPTEQLRRKFKHRVGEQLNYLVAAGYLKSAKKNMPGSVFSLSEEQGRPVMELLDIVDSFEQGDTETFKIGEKKAEEILFDPLSFATLLGKAREASSKADVISPDDLRRTIKGIIHRNPGISLREIGQKLAQTKKGRSLPAINEYVKDLEVDGLVMAKIVDKQRRFHPVKK